MRLRSHRCAGLEVSEREGVNLSAARRLQEASVAVVYHVFH